VSHPDGIDGIAQNVVQNRATAKACGTSREAVCAIATTAPMPSTITAAWPTSFSCRTSRLAAPPSSSSLAFLDSPFNGCAVTAVEVANQFCDFPYSLFERDDDFVVQFFWRW